MFLEIIVQPVVARARQRLRTGEGQNADDQDAIKRRRVGIGLVGLIVRQQLREGLDDGQDPLVLGIATVGEGDARIGIVTKYRAANRRDIRERGRQPGRGDDAQIPGGIDLGQLFGIADPARVALDQAYGGP